MKTTPWEIALLVVWLHGFVTGAGYGYLWASAFGRWCRKKLRQLERAVSHD